MTEIAQEVARLREMTVPELVEKYTYVFGTTPNTRSHPWLWKRIARKVQGDRYGSPRKTRDPLVGTVLTRNWRGQQIRVTVLETGYEFNDVVYRSLSAIAREITGAHWNGRLFFGLVSRRKAK